MRYITIKHIEPRIIELSSHYTVNIVGKSVENRPIYLMKIGNGERKILIWSQMHGNESTTTKGLLDFLYYLKGDEELLKSFEFHIIPMLNPDGAERYTRTNANEIDLNRDALKITQPESQLLRKICEEIKPYFAFNLHDQRTIFSAGEDKNPATMSFLAPSYNQEKEINAVREMVMQVCAVLNSYLQKYIPNQVGRFDDSFNINCIGDYLMYNNIPTILFEAGHYPNDYDREKTRELVCLSLIKAVQTLVSEDYKWYSTADYFDIPENKKLYSDIVIKNLNLGGEKQNINIYFSEILKDGKIHFVPHIDKGDISEGKYGHIEFNV